MFLLIASFDTVSSRFNAGYLTSDFGQRVQLLGHDRPRRRAIQRYPLAGVLP